MFPKFMISAFMLLSVIVFSTEAYDEETDTIIKLPNLGTIQGKILETAWTQREVLQFVDVKYGESPSGKYRFKVRIEDKSVKRWIKI